MDVDDKINFVLSTLDPMAWHTHRYIASVIGVEEQGEGGEHVGSALRALISGRRCILTAAHVIAQARSRYPRFAITAIRGEEPYELHGPPDRVDQGRDVAAYFLPDDYPRGELGFWPRERMDDIGDQLSTDFLFVHGFPAVRSRFSALAGGLMNRSFPYGVMRREDELPEDLDAFQFAMDFYPENLRGPDGNAADWLDPHGLSGSPVWRIGASGRRVDAWSADLSLLVGVVTQWRPDEKLLVATACRDVLEMFGQP